jgi:hypothetical protein
MKITIECNASRSLKINGLEVIRAGQDHELGDDEIIYVEQEQTYNPVTNRYHNYLTFKLKAKQYAIQDKDWGGLYGIWTEQAKLASNYSFV